MKLNILGEKDMQFSEKIVINASGSEIFEKYRNVSTWCLWDAEIKDSMLEGDFEENSRGVLTPTRGPKAKFELTEVTIDKSFTTQTKLPLCTMEFNHTLEESTDHTLVTHSVKFTGITGFFFNKVIGNTIKSSLPQTLKGLKAACE